MNSDNPYGAPGQPGPGGFPPPHGQAPGYGPPAPPYGAPGLQGAPPVFGPFPGPGQPPPGRAPKGGGGATKLVAAAVAFAALLGGGAYAAFGPSGGRSAESLPSEPVTLKLASAEANPFTPPVGRDQPGVAAVTGGGGQRDGSTEGLFAQNPAQPSCDGQSLVTALQSDPARASAWSQVMGIDPGLIPNYVASLTPVVLRADTGVIDHGYTGAGFTSYPAVLPAGSAVFINSYGEPTVRCFSGNPLTRNAAPYVRFAPTVTIVRPAPRVIERHTFVNVITNTSVIVPGRADPKPDPGPSPTTGGGGDTTGGTTTGGTVTPPGPDVAALEQKARDARVIADGAKGPLNEAQAKLDAKNQEIGTLTAQVGPANADLASRDGELTEAKKNVVRTEIDFKGAEIGKNNCLADAARATGTFGLDCSPQVARFEKAQADFNAAKDARDRSAQARDAAQARADGVKTDLDAAQNQAKQLESMRNSRQGEAAAAEKTATEAEVAAKTAADNAKTQTKTEGQPDTKPDEQAKAEGQPANPAADTANQAGAAPGQTFLGTKPADPATGGQPGAPATGGAAGPVATPGTVQCVVAPCEPTKPDPTTGSGGPVAGGGPVVSGPPATGGGPVGNPPTTSGGGQPSGGVSAQQKAPVCVEAPCNAPGAATGSTGGDSAGDSTSGTSSKPEGEINADGSSGKSERKDQGSKGDGD